MKISYNWLIEYIDFTQNPEEIGDRMDRESGEDPDGLVGIVVGEVMSCEQHPNEDNLKITKEDTGAEIFDFACDAYPPAVLLACGTLVVA